MEKLQVNNFLVIKSANFEVGRINLIIGSQANGKSVLAKLLYFFREFLSSTYLESIKNFELKKDLEKEALFDFEKYFPKYTWANKIFSIEYSINDFSIEISRKKNKSGGVSVKFDYSKNLIFLHKKLKNSYKKWQTHIEQNNISEISIKDIYSKTIDECVFDKEIGVNFNHSIFIPASRSFFANLQRNVFSFLSSNIDIDPFISSFGAQYESVKRYYGTLFYNEKVDKSKFAKINKVVESILVGKYKYEDDKDWIEYKGQIINLSNASSGQQEALPMLLVMSLVSLSLSEKQNLKLFIEEPEAHLFPISQKHIVSLIGLIYNSAKHDFVITTHSPYILTAINNMILARDVANEQGADKLNNIIDPDFTIAYEDVKAYTIKDGVLISILDDDSRLIGENIIDSVSDEFSAVFDDLLNLQAGVN
ncbi:AAA family ATPase [Candidatus Venteria ishoeyi]|uniref:Endonuclease GajA/Old nuclease/RecF-like AAA domain-containing protein n=1 Tax=Candidatus Venteria ishoeyi TaxID=1899563 RepID=A0A1H6F6F6_9GAMM|nr:AAA family ATPase [Candidatus Venteria ishoeyi]SEH04565.1 Uncharacterised protein [Candidatus Venteria ishoeyi]